MVLGSKRNGPATLETSGTVDPFFTGERIMAYLTPNETPGGMAGLPGNRVSDEDVIIQPDPEPIEAWRRAWRAIAAQLSTKALRALRKALENDDPRLIQSATTSPPPLQAVQDWPVQAACSLGYCGWQGYGLATVGEVHEYFAQVCFDAGERLGQEDGVRYFLQWFDETPRDTMRFALLVEVLRELCCREWPPYESGPMRHVG
jgi:hypothetical protein